MNLAAEQARMRKRQVGPDEKQSRALVQERRRRSFRSWSLRHDPRIRDSGYPPDHPVRLDARYQEIAQNGGPNACQLGAQLSGPFIVCIDRREIPFHFDWHSLNVSDWVFPWRPGRRREAA